MFLSIGIVLAFSVQLDLIIHTIEKKSIIEIQIKKKAHIAITTTQSKIYAIEKNRKYDILMKINTSITTTQSK